MEFTEPAEAPAKEGNNEVVQSVIAGQTWTRKIGKCVDPNCVQVHVDGSHGWIDETGKGGVAVAAANSNEQQQDEKDAAYVSPADRKISPLDVMETRPAEGQTFVYLVGTQGSKVTLIEDSLNYLADSLEDLTLRSNLVASMNGIQNLPNLTRLELYDNQIESIEYLESVAKLTILDLSFNAIREMGAVAACPLLEELYVAQNKLRKIEGIDRLQCLKILDLGANRIRSLKDCGLHHLVNLESLWLGKNKIELIEGIGNLSKLRKLDVQNNRLTSIGGTGDAAAAAAAGDGGEDVGIAMLPSLEELYLACNAITDVKGLPLGSPLNTVDLSTNQISSLEGIEQHKGLTEVWMTASNLASMKQLEPLKGLPEISCLYLEHSPIARDYEYRKAITAMLPTLVQLDATEVNRGAMK
jgi:protein phosphatase 1 regulatory subunit 7